MSKTGRTLKKKRKEVDEYLNLYQDEIKEKKETPEVKEPEPKTENKPPVSEKVLNRGWVRINENEYKNFIESILVNMGDAAQKYKSVKDFIEREIHGVSDFFILPGDGSSMAQLIVDRIDYYDSTARIKIYPTRKQGEEHEIKGLFVNQALKAVGCVLNLKGVKLEVYTDEKLTLKEDVSTGYKLSWQIKLPSGVIITEFCFRWTVDVRQL